MGLSAQKSSASKADAMVKEGRGLPKIHKNIVVKVPLIAEGLKATRDWPQRYQGQCHVVAFSPTPGTSSQQKAGAVVRPSPFIGRLDGQSVSNGMELIPPDSWTIYRNYDFKTPGAGGQLCAIPQHVVEAALAGGHIWYDAFFDFFSRW